MIQNDYDWIGLRAGPECPEGFAGRRHGCGLESGCHRGLSIATDYLLKYTYYIYTHVYVYHGFPSCFMLLHRHGSSSSSFSFRCMRHGNYVNRKARPSFQAVSPGPFWWPSLRRILTASAHLKHSGSRYTQKKLAATQKIRSDDAWWCFMVLDGWWQGFHVEFVGYLWIFCW